MTYTDAVEFFALLITELADPLDGLAFKPIWHEILYLRNRLELHHSDFQKPEVKPLLPQRVLKSAVTPNT